MGRLGEQAAVVSKCPARGEVPCARCPTSRASGPRSPGADLQPRPSQGLGRRQAGDPPEISGQPTCLVPAGCTSPPPPLAGEVPRRGGGGGTEPSTSSQRTQQGGGWGGTEPSTSSQRTQQGVGWGGVHMSLTRLEATSNFWSGVYSPLAEGCNCFVPSHLALLWVVCNGFMPPPPLPQPSPAEGGGEGRAFGRGRCQLWGVVSG
jgi:hypothetical protein